MELRHLRYFVAVAEELHFRRAAERLHVAQPAISEQIRKLEAELGVPLFLRTSRNVQLTAAGTVLLDDARRILRQAEAAQHAARGAGGDERDRLRLGYTPNVLPTAVPRTLARLRSATRHVALEIQTGDARSLLAEVRSGVLDAAVVCLPAPTAGLRVVPIGREEAVAAVPRDGRVAALPLTLHGLSRERLLTMGRASDPAFYDAVVSAFVLAELPANLQESRAPTVEQLLLEVTAGGGIAILPGSVRDRTTLPGIELRPIVPHPPGVDVGVVARNEPGGAFLSILLDELAVAGRATRAPVLAAL
jgi:DNA-binding transcriptional LysR family regulator